MRLPSLALAVLASLTAALALLAEVSVPSVFSDHMVLASAAPVPVWGKAAPGEVVTVAIAGQSLTATAAPDGKWKTTLAPLTPSATPLTLTLSGQLNGAPTNTFTISDVLVGEVWLASGQSNMDFRVAKTQSRYWCGLVNEAEEIAAANHPAIRMFIADFSPRDEPQSDVPGRWYVCSPATVGEFSAVGYLFARELHQTLNTPVGIVLTSFGASTAQAWTSAPSLRAHPKLASMLDDYAKACAAYDSGEAQKTYEKALADWTLAAATAKAESKPAPRKPGAPKNPHTDQHNPAVLYNGMVAPLIPYAIKGVIWYQGESNGYNAALYYDLMTTLITTWRTDWNQPGESRNFPFLSVQLAGHRAPTTRPVENSQTATVRDAQLRTLTLPNTALATAVDIGDEKDVHPKNKHEVARRLALAALRLAYQQPTPHSGPTVASVTPQGATLKVTFANTFGGLKAQNPPPAPTTQPTPNKPTASNPPPAEPKLTGFALQDDKGNWHTADAVIEGDSVILSSPAVTAPKAARYAWANNPPISLYNAANLPAYPFKTDP